jgi:energy-coupling factor transporter ATP-binding protein EcfA2
LNSKSSPLRLSKIKFYSGFDTDDGIVPLEIEVGKVLILVGPNNSGKSLALKEIEQWCSGQDNTRKVVDKIEINYPNDGDEGMQLLREFETQPPNNQLPQPGHIWVGQHVFNPGQGARHMQLHIDSMKTQFENRNLNHIRSYLTTFYTVRLDGRNRFSLVDDKSTGDLQSLPQNHLWALFKDDISRERVRKETQEAFNLHFVIDPTGMNVFRIRLSTKAPVSVSEEQGLDEAARTFHSKASHIMEFSDGVQAFVGLLSAVLSLKHKIILLDDPKLFYIQP